MAAPKRATHQVVKSGLYYTPGEGELEVGSQMTLTTKQAEKLVKRGFVKSLKDIKAVDVSGADAKALKEAQAELKATGEKLQKAEAELKTTGDALTKAQADLKTATAK